MSIEPESDERGDDIGTRFEGYSDYQAVSRSVAQSVDKAVESYALIHSRHVEQASISTSMASKASSNILSAAIKLLPELEYDEEEVELYADIVDDWTGEDGYIERLKQAQLTQRCPPWLHDFALQIRRAGWHLGYLKAGRETTTEDPDWVDDKVENMFE